MSTINAVASATSDSSAPLTTASNGMLDKDGFLKLLVGQLRQQDPMAAVGNQELMAQMTQLSMLEQVTNLTKANESLVKRMDTSQALDLIGRDVTYMKPDGTTASGVVEKVAFDEGLPLLTIGDDTEVTPGQVTEIK
jgi:flagellar basal-body rod modification protein FlgD